MFTGCPVTNDTARYYAKIELQERIERAVNAQIADEIDTGILTDAEFTADNIFDEMSGFEFDPRTRECAPKFPEVLDDLNHLKLAYVRAVYEGANSVTLPISPDIADAINALLTKEAASRIDDRLNSDNRF